MMRDEMIDGLQMQEASLVSVVAGLNVPAGRDRAVVREGLELVAISLCPSRLLPALALI